MTLRPRYLCFIAVIFLFSLSALAMADEPLQDDPYIWLEEVEGARALGYVEGLNAASLPRLESQPGFEADRQYILDQLNAPDRIAYGTFRGDYIYNFWQDETNVRGLIRRTSLESYKSDVPDWEPVLDIDALSKAEGANWVYKGMACLAPDHQRCLISLSPGGTDAAELREFDLMSKTFVDAGFRVEAAKSNAGWVDDDHLLIGSDFGAGSQTQSGYARTLRLWGRNTPLENAPEVFAVPETHMGLYVYSTHTQGGSQVYIRDAKTFWSGTYYTYTPGAPPKALPLPEDGNVVHFGANEILCLLRSPWGTFPAGALVSLGVGSGDDGSTGDPALVFAPSETQAIEAVSVAGSAVYVTLLDHVSGALIRLVKDASGTWTPSALDLPQSGAISVVSAHDSRDELFINFESFTQPETLYYAAGQTLERIQSMPERFDASDMKVQQLFATSADGTQIPYYVIKPKTARRGKTIPTWLHGYGGFEISYTPFYLPASKQRWLAQGGAYVIANIRGGGEYGPRWHQAALLKNRHKAFEDFAAVMDDLAERRITEPSKLGVSGGSNGGLLTGVMLTRYFAKHNAAIIAVPLLDMLRYHMLLAGASWTGEYGEPDNPDMRAYIETYSPYHNVSANDVYPEAFIYTSTKDDRVHPGHARKFAAKLAEAKKPFLYYENIEGGHAGAANRNQVAYRAALELAFMKRRLFEAKD